MQEIKYILVVDGKTVLRGQGMALNAMRRVAAKRGGVVLSLDSKRAV